jgi:DNA-binding response OmpR family regulator
VEDDPSVRELTCMVLRRYGYTIMSFDGPQACLAAVAAAGGCQADLLLTDVVMPGLSGRQLYERLSAMTPGLRVLYMSGYSADVTSAQGLLEGGVALLQKPFAPEALLGRVREILDS